MWQSGADSCRPLFNLCSESILTRVRSERLSSLRLSALSYLIRFSIRDSRARRGLSWLLLLSVSFALTGFIVFPSLATSRGQLSERFPCEDCPCGCSTAEHCWDKCCCHTDREKLAWADRNGVTPPDFLIARVEKSEQAIASAIKPACCHCGKSEAGTCEASSSTEFADSSDEDSSDEDSIGTSATKVILLWKAAECRGIQSLWTMLATVYVAPANHSRIIDLPFVGWVASFDERATSRHTPPDPPVP